MTRKRAAIGLAAIGLPVVGVLGLLFLRPGGPDPAAGDSTTAVHRATTIVAGMVAAFSATTDGI